MLYAVLERSFKWKLELRFCWIVDGFLVRNLGGRNFHGLLTELREIAEEFREIELN
jgi:hypothetical protein